MAEHESERRPWSPDEVAAVVDDYFAMLRQYLLGQKPNKALHNRQLRLRLDRRNASSVEMKHRNISAVLVELGVMPLAGYKPLPNYQRVLVEVVSERLASDSVLDDAAISFVETPAEIPLIQSSRDLLVERPSAPARKISDSRLPWRDMNPTKRDYLAREARNRDLGRAGEQLALKFEVDRLHAAGKSRLADRIEHVSEIKGDGAGFDILSFDEDGRERFIEVKTTAFIAETPFFITPNEVSFSDAHAPQFHLYRFFDFRSRPRMFVLPGSVAGNCRLDPVSYRASLLPDA